jgi:hypothetical protein
VICIEVTDKLIKCYCEFTACKKCTKIYILEHHKLAQCMSCHKLWNTQFISKNFTQAFSKQYKLHKEEYYYQKQISYLPIAYQEITRRKIDVHLRKFVKQLKNDSECNQSKATKEKTLELLKKYKILLFETSLDLDIDVSNVENVFQLKNLIDQILGDNHILDIERDIQIKRPCPYTDCHGFLEKNYECLMCKSKTCRECLEIKREQHKCVSDVLESMRVIKKDSKNCPGCGSIIYRISGCIQMFCTMCHVAFNWKTLQIETGVVHNPHYFDYQRQQQLPVPVLGLCGRQLNNEFSINFAIKFRFDAPKIVTIVYNILHISHVWMPSLQRFLRPVEPAIEYQDLQIRYIENNINQQQFKRLLVARKKRKEMNQDIYELLEMYAATMSDLIFNLYDSSFDKGMMDVYNEIISLKHYVTNQYLIIRKAFTSKITHHDHLLHMFKVDDQLLSAFESKIKL